MVEPITLQISFVTLLERASVTCRTVFADSPEVFGSKLRRVHTLTWSSLGAERMEKVRVLAISVSVILNFILEILSFLMFVFPVVSVVDAFCVLKFVQQLFVFINDFGQILNPVGSVE